MVSTNSIFVFRSNFEVKVERMISEPTAAAVAYGLYEKEKDTRFLVFDLGINCFSPVSSRKTLQRYGYSGYSSFNNSRIGIGFVLISFILL